MRARHWYLASGSVFGVAYIDLSLCMAGDDGSYERLGGYCLGDGIQRYLFIDEYVRIHVCMTIYISSLSILDSTQSSFCSTTISTGYEPGACCNLYFEYYIYISRSRASKPQNHPLRPLFVTVAMAAHKHTTIQHHHHCHHHLHTSTTSTFTMLGKIFKNDERVIAKPTSCSSIPF